MKLHMLLAILLVPALAPAALDQPDPDAIPRGYSSIKKIDAVKAEARKQKHMVAVVTQGAEGNDAKCKAALEVATKTFRSKCEMVFVKVADLKAKAAKGTLPPMLAALSNTVTDGATLDVLVFNAEMYQLVGRLERDELNDDEEAVRELKKKIADSLKTTYSP